MDLLRLEAHPTASSDDSDATPLFTHDLFFLPIPTWLRSYPGKPCKFGLMLNISMGFAGTFTVTNLYYCQPLLLDLAASFGVSHSRVSVVPTLLQAGYAVGVVFISPLGDLVRRRQLILLLMILSTTLTIGLAVTRSFVAFQALSFLVGVTSIIVSIMQPLAADLAPPERRGTAISVVIAGLLLGAVVSRVIAGVLGQFASWRTVYYFAIGIQILALIIVFFTIPDAPPSSGKDKDQLTYLRILGTMAKFAVTEPAVIQACFISLSTGAAYTNFWVTLTFLLGGPLYNYSTLVIGLFGLVGMVGVLLGPFTGRFIDVLYPWHATFIAIVLLTLFNVINATASGLNVGAVIVVSFGVNLFRQMQQAATATIVLSIAEEARGRMNALNILAQNIQITLTQVMGTSVGTSVFLNHGWRADGWLSVALCGWQVLVLLVRGPHCARHTWFGSEGGWQMFRRRASVPQGRGDEDAEEGVVNEKGAAKSIPSTHAALEGS
ncbi:MFS superfamily [Roridomyces roridus]|uniref:MFS superfamily n=1 Tax=Roridomyces roridus TaxID=1738132 RepID=A0AAD7BPJ2_9AGAR|nr:MFS superfamily [Roridomyces roridus]